MSLKEGLSAPDFTLTDQSGKKVKLSDFKGKWVLLYFYPRDNTPGCTTEACSLRDNIAAFRKLGMVILGVSIDSVASHQKFAEKLILPFKILSDENKEAVKKYGVWQKKEFMGKEFMGVVRRSFLIDPQGKIARIYDKVKPETHAFEVLADKKDYV